MFLCYEDKLELLGISGGRISGNIRKISKGILDDNFRSRLEKMDCWWGGNVSCCFRSRAR